MNIHTQVLRTLAIGERARLRNIHIPHAGGWIYFAEQGSRSDTSGVIRRVRPTGDTVETVVDGPQISPFYGVSPDGKWLAYLRHAVVDRNTRFADTIYVLDLQSGAPRAILPSNDPGGSIVGISPDGSQILRTPLYAGSYPVVLTSIDGSEQVLLDDYRTLKVFDVRWGGSGPELLVWSWVDHFHYVIRPLVGERHVVPPDPAHWPDHWRRALAWQTRGPYFVAALNRTQCPSHPLTSPIICHAGSVLYAVDWRDGQSHVIVDHATDWLEDWAVTSPDDSHVAYVAEGHDLYVREIPALR